MLAAAINVMLERIEELGGSPDTELERYARVLEDFDARTTPGSWWERMLKAYVGYGVADDFCKAAAAGLDEGTRDLVRDLTVELGLGLVRMQERHHRIEDVFREGGAGSVQPV